MGKHDKVIAQSSEEFYQNKIKDLEKRLAFAEENCEKLRTEVSKYNRWISEVQAAAEDRITEQKARIAKLEATIVRLAVN